MRTVQVVFRDARDALRWCIAMQMQLLALPWSKELLAQPDARVVCVSGKDGPSVPVPPLLTGLAPEGRHVRFSHASLEYVFSLICVLGGTLPCALLVL